MNFSDPIAISLISTLGGITIAYITNVLSKKVQERRVDKQPKDRWEQMFDGYERLLRQKDLEDDRKARLIKALQNNVNTLEAELANTKQTLDEVTDQFEISNSEVQSLKKIVYEMHKEYKADKASKKAGTV